MANYATVRNTCVVGLNVRRSRHFSYVYHTNSAALRMRHRRTAKERLANRATLLLLAFLGCSGSTTSSNPIPDGAYALATVDGAQLPARVYSDPTGRYFTDVLDGQLVFEKDSVTRLVRWRNVDIALASALVYRRGGQMVFSARGTVLVFGTGGDYMKADTAQIDATSIHVRVSVQTANGSRDVDATYVRR